MRRYLLKLWIFTLLITTSCIDDSDPNPVIFLTSASSIFFHNNKVLVSGFENVNGQFSTRYWMDGVNVDEKTFFDNLDPGHLVMGAVDESFRSVFLYKDANEIRSTYKFDPGSLEDDGGIFYIKDDVKISPDTFEIGNLTAVYPSTDSEYLAGFFGEVLTGEGGNYLSPTTPFYWDGVSSQVTTLSIPDGQRFYWVNSIYVHDNSDVYVSGSMDVPMYWKNDDPVILNNLYGRVSQIQVSDSYVYAVGLYNKSNSNSTGHTACYWKNEELIELEDNAQATGIFVVGADIYVAGSLGSAPIDYRACYWKNGVRVDLE